MRSRVFLRSEAYAVLGTLASNAKNWPEAEANLRKSIDAFPQQVDSVAVLRLAVALDMQNKIPDALKYANQAVDLTKDRPDSAAGKAARAEQDRLTKLNSGAAPGRVRRLRIEPAPRLAQRKPRRVARRQMALPAVPPMKEREITALEEGLGYHFRRRAVIEQAVTHSSQAREQEAQQAGESKYKVSDNEQLEFLGDAVLALVTSEELFQRFPQFREGELSKLRAHLVSERHLIQVAQQLELGHYLRLGRGEEKSGGRGKTALLVDALEAILAAIYLDGGLEVAREFVLRNVIAPELERMEQGGGTLADHRFQVCVAGSGAESGPAAARIRAGGGGRSGAQQDVYGGGALAYERQARRGICGAGAGLHQENCGTGCGPAIADVSGLAAEGDRRESGGARRRWISRLMDSPHRTPRSRILQVLPEFTCRFS